MQAAQTRRDDLTRVWVNNLAVLTRRVYRISSWMGNLMKLFPGRRLRREYAGNAGTNFKYFTPTPTQATPSAWSLYKRLVYSTSSTRKPVLRAVASVATQQPGSESCSGTRVVLQASLPQSALSEAALIPREYTLRLESIELICKGVPMQQGDQVHRDRGKETTLHGPNRYRGDDMQLAQPRPQGSQEA